MGLGDPIGFAKPSLPPSNSSSIVRSSYGSPPGKRLSLTDHYVRLTAASASVASLARPGRWLTMRVPLCCVPSADLTKTHRMSLPLSSTTSLSSSSSGPLHLGDLKTNESPRRLYTSVEEMVFL
ncbi:hypothetical protein BC936DRAFT_148800 [Jimgerdemannia flammicorona]|uniref:Uncharacterized protein n=1 Tax=Jimgerdemannia flammicorona TaxID=994334 RepID=A0A433DKJ1_9FUNG|nr:hypothetical protein BC936DRAFT_148800 [Jimgerdemannia flammicorona]